jgi:hypothetical protein
LKKKIIRENIKRKLKVKVKEKMNKKSNSFFESLQKRTSVEPFTDDCNTEHVSTQPKRSKEFWLFRKKCFMPCFAWILLSLCYAGALVGIIAYITG